MLDGYSLKMPQAIYGGSRAMEQLRPMLSGVKKAAVFTDNGVASAGLLERPLAQIRGAGTEIYILQDLPAEPTCDEAQEIVDRFRESGAEAIVAAGGGSVMDIAKLASILADGKYTVRDLLGNPLLAQKCVPSFMIPTTAGTGAEATPNSIVLVPEQELKVGIVNPAMIADAVILDPEMIRRLPRKIAAATGIDALCHAIECFTSKKATPFSDMFALEALDKILSNLERACDDPEALDAKEQMLTAAFYAGVAITASGTTAVHALSYPLGGKYHIAHGVSNAMLLVPVMKFNEPVCRPWYAKIYDRVTKGKGRAADDRAKSEWLLRQLEEIVEHLDIPANLKEFGVPEEDLEILVASGMEVQRLLVNNRREVRPEDARALYRQILQ